MIPPRRIALCGGGMKGIAHVGALEVLEERGLLSSMREVLGTSAGAMIAMCLVAGYTLPELRLLCTAFDFRLMTNFEPDAMIQATEQFGIDDGANLYKLLGVLLRTKGVAADATFAELAAIRAEKGKPPLGLRVYATDLDRGASREFSVVNTPGVSVRLAVRASMSVPMFFTPIVDPETGGRLVDGGVISSFPFFHLTAAERAETIGVTFSQAGKFRTPDASSSTKDQTFVSYIHQIYYSIYAHQTVGLLREWADRILEIDGIREISLQFDAGPEIKTLLLQRGREGAERFLARSRPPPVRRNSTG